MWQEESAAAISSSGLDLVVSPPNSGRRGGGQDLVGELDPVGAAVLLAAFPDDAWRGAC